MKTLRTWIGPLLREQREAGIDIGRSEERKQNNHKLTHWAKLQQAAGVQLDESIPLPVGDEQSSAR